jgi:hypothetical protein
MTESPSARSMTGKSNSGTTCGPDRFADVSRQEFRRCCGSSSQNRVIDRFAQNLGSFRTKTSTNHLSSMLRTSLLKILFFGIAREPDKFSEFNSALRGRNFPSNGVQTRSVGKSDRQSTSPRDNDRLPDTQCHRFGIEYRASVTFVCDLGSCKINGFRDRFTNEFKLLIFFDKSWKLYE